MSLQTRLSDLITRIGTEFKSIRTLIGGSGTSTLSGLSLPSGVAGTHIVEALNSISSQYARKDVGVTFSSDLTVSGAVITGRSGNDTQIELRGTSSPAIRYYEGVNGKVLLQWSADNDSFDIINEQQSVVVRINDALSVGSPGGSYYDVWHSGNDGASSGLDADLLDGQHGSYYLNYNNLTNTPTVAQINDTTTSTTTLWSSSKVNTEITSSINAVLDGAPAALDTLNELAAAINDNASYASTVTAALATKANSSDVYTRTELGNPETNLVTLFETAIT